MNRLIAAVALLLALVALAPGCRREADPDTVILWHAYQGEERAALEAAIDNFNASSSETRIAPVSVAYDAFADKITNAIPNGNGPDLFIFAHDRLGDWVAADLIEPIEYYVDDALADGYAYDAIAAMAYRNSLYGLPLAVKSVALFYRTDMVERPPHSTDELREYSRAHPDTYAMVYQNTDLYGHAPWLHGCGGRLFDEAGNVTIATPEAAKAIELARSFVRDHITPQSSDATMVASLFNEGKAAMALSGPWFIADIPQNVPWAVAPLPVVSETGMAAAPFLGAEGVLMSARARHKDRAFEAMRAIAGDASAIIRAGRAKQVVPNIAAYDDPQIGADPVLSAFRAQLEHSVPMPASPAMRMVWTPYKNALQKTIDQGQNIASALRAADREFKDYLRGAAGKKAGPK